MAVGEKSMVAKMNYVKGDYASTHAHPNEQSGYVISGNYRLKIETLNFIKGAIFAHIAENAKGTNDKSKISLAFFLHAFPSLDWSNRHKIYAKGGRMDKNKLMIAKNAIRKLAERDGVTVEYVRSQSPYTSEDELFNFNNLF
ncbi:MAG TPA: hypothetical protein VN456_14500 [Desulfosporosinus sp.]|nr:hypothetical protein [Desulfosporosinus sp.]